MSYAYDADSNRTRMSVDSDVGPSFTNSYNYDGFNNLSRILQTVAGDMSKTKGLEFKYNLQGEMTRSLRYNNRHRECDERRHHAYVSHIRRRDAAVFL